jgi:hypothetical protein
LESQWRYAVSTALKMENPSCFFGADFHLSRSRFSYFDILTVPDHEEADLTMSCSSRR